MAPDSHTSQLQALVAASGLLVDRTTADISRHMGELGIETIVLKGPAVSEWLYADGVGLRSYGDSDLLLAPWHWVAAQEVLSDLGFFDDLGPLAHPRMESFASHAWGRGRENVDLHCTLWGVGVEPDVLWNLLSADTVPQAIGGRELRVLAPAPRAMHVALHAAQHGPGTAKTLEDLRRALEQVPEETWVQAAAVAHSLGATGAFATGLRLVPAGEALAERLGVARERSVDALLRVDQVPMAQGFLLLAETPGLLAKLRLVLAELAPAPAFMRWWSPVARRGRRGLVAAYVLRPLWLARYSTPGLRAWWNARRQRSNS